MVKWNMKWGDAEKKWFVGLVESFVEDPDEIIDVGRTYANVMPLALYLKVKKSSQAIFTQDLCERLARQAEKRSGAEFAIVFLENAPHKIAKKEIRDAIGD